MLDEVGEAFLVVVLEHRADPVVRQAAAVRRIVAVHADVAGGGIDAGHAQLGELGEEARLDQLDALDEAGAAPGGVGGLDGPVEVVDCSVRSNEFAGAH